MDFAIDKILIRYFIDKKYHAMIEGSCNLFPTFSFKLIVTLPLLTLVQTVTQLHDSLTNCGN